MHTPREPRDSTTKAGAPATTGLVIHWAARYDWLAWLVTHGRERRLRERLLDLADVGARMTVLDVGCGTGTLAIAAARRVGPEGAVTGIDASPAMVARAQWKASRARSAAAFDVATAESLPFDDGHADRVLCTLML